MIDVDLAECKAPATYGSSTKIIVDLLVFSLLIGGKTVLHVHVLRIVDTGYVLMH